MNQYTSAACGLAGTNSLSRKRPFGLILLLLVVMPGAATAAAPGVAIVVPTAASTVSGPVRVSGDILHTKPVVKTELLAGGKVVATSTDGDAFSLVWDAAKVSRGRHTLTVRATDADGTVGRADVDVHVRQTFNVKDFKARGDGKADDTAAIQATLTAARKAGGGSVYLPKGTYRIVPPTTSVFAVGSNVEVRGDGPASVLKIADGAGDYNYIFGQQDAEFDFRLVENVSFRDFRVDQNPAGNKAADVREGEGIQNVLQLFAFKNVTVQGVHFDPEPGIQAIVLDSGGKTAGGVVIDGCSFRFVRARSTQKTPYDHSSVYTETPNVVIRNNVFQADVSQAAITAVEVHAGPRVRVQGNKIDGFQVGVIVTNAIPEYKDVPDGAFEVRGNQILRTTQGISLWSNTGRTLRGVVIRDNEITMAVHRLYTDVWLGIALYHLDGDDKTRGDFEKIEIVQNTVSFEKLKRGTVDAVGIELAPAGRVRDVTVRGNTIVAPPARGIHLGDAARRTRLEEVRVEENTVVDAGWEAAVAAPSRAAIVLDKVRMTNVQVRNNTLKDTGKAGAPQGRQTIRAHPERASQGVSVTPNQLLPKGNVVYDIDRATVK